MSKATPLLISTSVTHVADKAVFTNDEWTSLTTFSSVLFVSLINVCLLSEKQNKSIVVQIETDIVQLISVYLFPLVLSSVKWMTCHYESFFKSDIVLIWRWNNLFYLQSIHVCVWDFLRKNFFIHFKNRTSQNMAYSKMVSLKI